MYNKLAKIRLSTVYVFLLYIIAQTSSFDIVLNIKVSGFSIRLVYIVMSFLILIFILNIDSSRNIRIKSLGIIPFSIWFLFLILFLNNTPLISRNIGYLLWLLLHFFFIITCTSIIKNSEDFFLFFKLYIICFLVSSMEGLFQLALGLFGIDFFVAEDQWWIPGRLPRINGFSYEPSYFSTYMIIGFSICYYLVRNNFTLYRRLIRFTLFTSFSVILLSTSRMGILVMFVEIFAYELYLRRKSIVSILVFVILFVSSVSAAVVYIINNDNLSFLLSGLGINGGAAHSSAQRLDGFLTQIDILLKNPFKGYSLGGVSQAIAFEKGEISLTQETIKPYDISMNIFLEVLTASGIVGYGFFLLFIKKIILKPYSLSKKINDINNSTLLKSFIWAMIFELVILCFNQNILRAYFWNHIAFLNLVYFYLKPYSAATKN